jgi:uncharacterized membrane protein required for colicin V production
MNIVDIVIILLIVLGAVVGFKQGAIRRLTSFLGTIIIAIVAFKFKNNLSVLMYENLPFFHFNGLIKGVEVINILIYELLAFIIIFMGLTILLRILLVVSGLIERILKMTVFLSIPSKILGIFIGALEYYIYVFLLLVFLSVPAFNLNEYLDESKLATSMINNTPILSNMALDTVNTYTEVYNILSDSNNQTSTELNIKIVRILLDNGVVTTDSLDKLIERGKIDLGDGSILDSYREE